jgi:hypothetical protein
VIITNISDEPTASNFRVNSKPREDVLLWILGKRWQGPKQTYGSNVDKVRNTGPLKGRSLKAKWTRNAMALRGSNMSYTEVRGNGDSLTDPFQKERQSQHSSALQ